MKAKSKKPPRGYKKSLGGFVLASSGKSIS
jgi:hypothetical protein